MSSPASSYSSTEQEFRVKAYEPIDYVLRYATGVFDPNQSAIADIYSSFGRCLMVIDESVNALYGENARAYFAYHGIDLTIFALTIREKEKSLATLERIVDAFGDFELFAAPHRGRSNSYLERRKGVEPLELVTAIYRSGDVRQPVVAAETGRRVECYSTVSEIYQPF